MPTDFYLEGQKDVYAYYGMDKEALAIPKILSRAGKYLGHTRVGKSLLKKLPTKQGIKKFMIGDPRRFMYEHRMKMHKKPGSLLREGLRAEGVLGKTMLYGLPAVEAVNIMRDKPGDRAERMGGLLGGTALGLAAWGPTGMLGSMAAGTLGERLGRGLGRTAKFVTGQTPDVRSLKTQNLAIGDN